MQRSELFNLKYATFLCVLFVPVDCPHPTCSGHGYCAEGTCICKKGWKGLDCALMDQDALQCLPDCSGHGTFDLDTQVCHCEPKWSGDDCSKGMSVSAYWRLVLTCQ